MNAASSVAVQILVSINSSSARSAFNSEMNEVRRITEQTARQASANARIREQAARQLANVEIREAKRSANELIREIDRIRTKSTTGGGGGSGGLFGAVLGGNIASSAITATVGLAREGASAWIDYASKLEQARIGFTTMTGSAVIANQHLTELQNYAKTTPFQFGELVTASQKLQGVGIEAKRIIPTLTNVGNILAASGRIDSFDYAVKALGDIQAKGKLAGQEIIQLANAGIPAGKILSEAFNKPQSEILKLSENGQISAEMMFYALDKVSKVKFGDAMQMQSRTFSGALSNITDGLYQASEIAFRPFYEQISKFAVNAGDEINKQQGDLNAIGGIIGKYIVAGLTSGLKVGISGAIQYAISAAKGEASFFIGTQSLLEGIAEGAGYKVDLTPFFAPNKAAADERRKLENLGNTPVTNNGITTSFDPVTNTIKQIGGEISKVPDLSAQLNAKQAQQDVAALADITRKYQLSVNENASKIRLAEIQSEKVYSPEQRISIAKRVLAEETQLLNQQRQTLNQNFASEIAANSDNATKIKKINIERKTALEKNDTDLKLKQIQTQREIADAEADSFEKRRTLLIKFQSLQEKIIGSGLANSTFNLNRKISFGIDIEGSFAALRSATQNNFRDLFNIAESQYQTQLQQIGLSNGEKEQLQREHNVRIADLAENNRRSQLELDDRLYDERQKQFDQFASRQEQKLRSGQDFLSNLTNIFDPANFQVGLAKTVFDKFVVDTNDTLDIIIERTRLELNATAEIANAFLTKSELTNDQTLRREYEKRFNEQQDKHKVIASQLEEIANPTPFRKTLYALLELSNAFDKNAVSIGDFDRASKLSLELQQQYSAQLLATRIENETYREKRALDRGDVSSAGFIRANIEALTDEQSSNAIKNRIALYEQYRKSYQGLLETNNKLTSGDKITVLGIQDQSRKDLLTQQNNELTKQITLEYQLANSPLIDSTRIVNSLLEKQIELRGRETEAIIRTNSAQIELSQQGIYSATQANASVLEFLASQRSVTGIISDAKIGVITSTYDVIDRGLEKITKRLGVVGSLIKDVISGFLRLAVNQIFLRMFGLSSGGISGGSQSNSGGGGFNIGNILGGLLNRGGASGTVSGASGGGSIPNVIQQLTGRSTGSIGSLPVSGNTVQSALGLLNPVQGLSNPTGGGSASGAGGLLSRLFGGGSRAGGASGGGGIISSLAGALPLLGLGLGGQIGSGSRTGSILGSIGGLGAGALGTALLGGGGLLGGVLGTAYVGTGIAGGTGLAGGLAGLGLSAGAATAAAATIIGAPIAAALIGAYFISRSAKRRKEEVQRTQILGDSKSQLQTIIDGVRSGRIDSSSALSQAAQIRADYIQKVSALKDRKTRDIALQTVRELDSMIETIKKEGRRADYAKAFDNKLIPTFAVGGTTSGYFTGSGGSSYGDTIHARISRDEVILNPQGISNLGGYDALRRAGIRGIGSGGSSYGDGYSQRTRSGNSGNNPTAFYSVIVANEAAADAFISKVKPRAIAKKVNAAVYSGDDAGLVDGIEKKLTGQFN